MSINYNGLSHLLFLKHILDFPGGLVVKNQPNKKKSPPINAEDAKDRGLIPGPGRYPGGGHGYPLQYSYLENAWTDKPWGLSL